MEPLTVIQWTAATALALCALPQAYQTYKTKSAKGLNWLSLLMWTYGELGLLIGYAPKMIEILPIYLNYMLNFICLCVIIRYKIKGK